jgi:prefoldin subunit 5
MFGKKNKSPLEIQEKTIKEQRKEIRALKKEIKELKKEMKTLKASHNTLKGLEKAGTVVFLESSLNTPDEKWEWPTENDLLNLHGYTGL